MDDRTNMALERIAGLTVKQSAFLMEYAKTENTGKKFENRADERSSWHSRPNVLE